MTSSITEDDKLLQGDRLAERLRCIQELSRDYYWEQNSRYQFTFLSHRDIPADDSGPRAVIGRTSWELGGIPVEHGGKWDEHVAVLEARQPFEGFLIRRVDPVLGERYLSMSGQPVFDADGEFQGYRGITRDVTREKRNERLLNVERAIGRILLEAADTHNALEAAIRTLCESEGWDSGLYWRLDEDRQAMRYYAGWWIDSPAIDRLNREARQLVLAPGTGLVGRVWQRGEAQWVEDIGKETHLLRRDIPERTGWKNALLFPVIAEGEPVGVLDFNASRIAPPDQRLLELIRVLGAQIGNFCARTEALDKLRESEERYQSTVELAAIGISHVSPDGRFIHVNQQLCGMLGYSREELLVRTVKAISHPEDQDVTDEARDRLRAGEIDYFKLEKRYLRKDGTPIWVRLSVAEKRGRDGRSLYDISVVEDISARKKAEEEVHYLATHDRMTDLPNRTLFSQLLAQSVKSAKRKRPKLAVLFVDLDRFKQINDSLGHEAGDLLLAEIARRFRACLRDCDVVARLGGDEFVVMIEELEDKEQAAVVARHLIAAAMRPVQIQGQECRITASIGIALYPRDGADESAVLKNADLAMYLAKEEGKNNYQFYSSDIRPQAGERIALESQLRSAVDNNEFQLHYQAKVSIGSGEIRGVEALLRWNCAELGNVPPSQFIPLAEESGLILPLGRWVLRQACEQGVAWQREGLPPLAVSVNLSPRQFSDPELLPFIKQTLDATGLDAGLLELEITESMVMHNTERAVRKLRAIKKLGVKIAIDDFGTGYSSLSQLKRFPVDTLKVDRSFIREIPCDEEDKAITRAIIAMGKTLGLTVVAEGVETAAQLEFLRDNACDEMQGFYISRPAAPEEFAALLRGRAERK